MDNAEIPAELADELSGVLDDAEEAVLTDGAKAIMKVVALIDQAGYSASEPAEERAAAYLAELREPLTNLATALGVR